MQNIFSLVHDQNRNQNQNFQNTNCKLHQLAKEDFPHSLEAPVQKVLKQKGRD